jgi:mycothiol synthase
MNSPIRPLRIGPVAAAERNHALQLVFRRLPEVECHRQVEMLLRGAASQDQLLEGLVGAYRGKSLAAVMLSQIQPGKTAAVYPPQMTAEESPATAHQLLAWTLQWLARREVRIAQSLLETDAQPEADLLREGGFQYLTDLLYLVCADGEFPTAPPQVPLVFEPYGTSNHARLARIVGETYEQTRDCPQLNGIRDVEDVLAGYRATGVFAPGRWLIVRHEDADVGCLVLTEHVEHGAWELVYMGIVPGARGHGWGTAIARHAQWLTRQGGGDRLVLAVDASNGPALRMYAAAGFQAWDRRAVFLKTFTQNS